MSRELPAPETAANLILLEYPFRQVFAYEVLYLRNANRLMQNLVCTRLHGALRDGGLAEGGLYDDRYVSRGVICFEGRDSLIATHFGQAEIHQDQVGLAGRGVFYAFLPVSGQRGVMAHFFNDHHEQLAPIGIIFDNEHFFHSVSLGGSGSTNNAMKRPKVEHGIVTEKARTFGKET